MYNNDSVDNHHHDEKSKINIISVHAITTMNIIIIILSISDYTVMENYLTVIFMHMIQ